MAALRLLLLAAVLGAAVFSAQATRNARIVGGKPIDIKVAPWLAQIVLMREDNPNEFLFSACGGAIVDEYHILTAAHCFVESTAVYAKKPDQLLRVVVGANKKYWGDALDEGQLLRVKSLTPNPEFAKQQGNWFKKGEMSYSDRHDIAVLRLAEPLQ